MLMKKEKFLKTKKLCFLIKEYKKKKYMYIIRENKLVLIVYLNKLFCVLNNYIYIRNLKDYNTFKKFLKKKFFEAEQGFFVDLLIKGIGYSVYLYGKYLYFNLGFSHYIAVKVPNLVNVLKFKRRLVFYSYDKNYLNSFVSKLYSFRGLDVYKGQGIVDKNMNINLKEGKKK